MAKNCRLSSVVSRDQKIARETEDGTEVETERGDVATAPIEAGVALGRAPETEGTVETAIEAEIGTCGPP